MPAGPARLISNSGRAQNGKFMTAETHIKKPIPAEYPALANIWAASVRATHDFLAESDFQEIYGQLSNAYLPAVDLYAFYYTDPAAAELRGELCAAWPGKGPLPENGLCVGFVGCSRLEKKREEALAQNGLSPIPGIQVEMLFVDPVFHRRGIGRALLDFVRRRWPRIWLDVNEQNQEAARFYFKYGFKRIGRSELDGQGRPYPLLHLYYQAPGFRAFDT